jgi:hypothetical protein
LGHPPITAVPKPQEGGAEQRRPYGAGQNTDLDVVVSQRPGAEGQLTDQQRDGEPDAGQPVAVLSGSSVNG